MTFRPPDNRNANNDASSLLKEVEWHVHMCVFMCVCALEFALVDRTVCLRRFKERENRRESPDVLPSSIRGEKESSLMCAQLCRMILKQLGNGHDILKRKSARASRLRCRNGLTFSCSSLGKTGRLHALENTWCK